MRDRNSVRNKVVRTLRGVHTVSLDDLDDEAYLACVLQIEAHREEVRSQFASYTRSHGDFRPPSSPERVEFVPKIYDDERSQ
jgi:hypothetical protein